MIELRCSAFVIPMQMPKCDKTLQMNTSLTFQNKAGRADYKMVSLLLFVTNNVVDISTRARIALIQVSIAV